MSNDNDRDKIYRQEVWIGELITTRILRRGKGKRLDDPVRIVLEVWTKDGHKIAECDPTIKEPMGNL